MAIKVAGAVGDPVAGPWLLECMDDTDLARPAGEAFRAITGVDLVDEQLEAEWPDGFDAGPTEDPADNNVAMDADEDLPWPDPERVRSWWDKNVDRFARDTRHLLGMPINRVSLSQVLATGLQRERTAAALETTLANRGTPLFEVRARGDRQQGALGL